MLLQVSRPQEVLATVGAGEPLGVHVGQVVLVQAPPSLTGKLLATDVAHKMGVLLLRIQPVEKAYME